MRYPMIRRQAVREVSIPKLSGGLNLRDNLTGVRDNQLTDCVNMWFKGGMLKTRPPFVTDNARFNRVGQYNEEQKITTRFHDDIRVNYDGLDCVCATNLRTLIGQNSESVNFIDFEFQAVDKSFSMPSIENIKGEKINYFLVQFKNTLYCFISNYSIYKLEYEKSSDSYNRNPYWQKIELSQSYIPTVMTHCKAFGNEFKGVQVDSFNAITNSFKMIYSTVNTAALTDGKVKMEYPLITISSLKNFKNTTFKAKHTKIDGSVTEHTVVYNLDGLSGTCSEKTEITPADKLYMYIKINGTKVILGFTEARGGSTAVQIGSNDFVEDNLEITAIITNTENLELNKIFGCKKAIWFGGTGGIYSGSRLFLGGNETENEKSLMIWSDFNNPLYFPENCYAYVGNNSSGVTAFSRQDDKLIIFKENEIYYTYYAYNGVTAESVINQSVVDYQANVVKFPVIVINANIGCDCPDSVQMCRNRLVWASSNGRIYTLCKMNQYDEHTVYEIAEMIKPRLKKYKDRLKSATSADFDGHYILFLKDCAFVCDYNCYGYQYVYSYSKNEDANLLIPWYYWEFSFLRQKSESDEYNSACICTLDDTILMRSYFNSSEKLKSGFVSFSMKENELLAADEIFYNDFSGGVLKLGNSAINCKATTKLFELGGGSYCFNTEVLVLKCGSNSGAKISVEILSELGKEKSVILNKRKYESITDTNLIRPKRIYPTMKSTVKIGINLECEGLIIIDGLSVQYRLLGGAK